MTDLSHIRNFSIIAHIDHGKSTLADRLMEECGAVDLRQRAEQLLDSMDLERERGITIKATAVQLNYTADNGETYDLNLIDTPGHVDFGYEVSRSLAACEGAVLVVDASQGVEAQTLANTYQAIDAGLEVLPVINKIDLPSARPQEVKAEVEDIIGIPAEDAPEISAKNGINIHSVLEMIVEQVPPPKGSRDKPLQALIFDSQYDSYRGVIVYTRIMEGTVRAGMDIRMMATGAEYKVVEVGTMNPLGLTPRESLGAGEVGYITASIKTVSDTRVGDTVTGVANPAAEPLPGYRQVQPMVYSGIYPADGAKYQDLREALEKLKLNDASMRYEPESSIALGFGFRCGFLGLLHMEIIQERLEREYNLDLITTAPNVVYRVTKTNGQVLMVDNPLDYPDPADIQLAEEPYVKASLIAPQEYVGNIMELCQQRRGEFKDMVYLDGVRVELHYEMPLNEIIYDFFDALKSRTRGYGSLDYEFLGYRPSRLVKLDILLNGDIVDALSFILFADNAYPRARKICEKLKENIPRAQFEIPVQAAIGGKIIARETIKALRKDVLAKCYGGDITRKKKLLEKQKEGKKRMRTFGTVSVPSEAFMAVLKLDED
ncbi:MAG: translation elongation factor 4 [Candidatus Faecousia sp.]|nr:translation elongation factor 4 [Clostridiales bacterium]MDY5642074.1 translation elongation factor 4 [Candidatus Faecousia sp.]